MTTPDPDSPKQQQSGESPPVALPTTLELAKERISGFRALILDKSLSSLFGSNRQPPGMRELQELEREAAGMQIATQQQCAERLQRLLEEVRTLEQQLLELIEGWRTEEKQRKEFAERGDAAIRRRQKLESYDGTGMERRQRKTYQGPRKIPTEEELEREKEKQKQERETRAEEISQLEQRISALDQQKTAKSQEVERLRGAVHPVETKIHELLGQVLQTCRETLEETKQMKWKAGKLPSADLPTNGGTSERQRVLDEVHAKHAWSLAKVSANPRPSDKKLFCTVHPPMEDRSQELQEYVQKGGLRERLFEHLVRFDAYLTYASLLKDLCTIEEKTNCLRNIGVVQQAVLARCKPQAMRMEEDSTPSELHPCEGKIPLGQDTLYMKFSEPQSVRQWYNLLMGYEELRRVYAFVAMDKIDAYSTVFLDSIEDGHLREYINLMNEFHGKGEPYTATSSVRLKKDTVAPVHVITPYLQKVLCACDLERYRFECGLQKLGSIIRSQTNPCKNEEIEHAIHDLTERISRPWNTDGRNTFDELHESIVKLNWETIETSAFLTQATVSLQAPLGDLSRSKGLSRRMKVAARARGFAERILEACVQRTEVQAPDHGLANVSFEEWFAIHYCVDGMQYTIATSND